MNPAVLSAESSILPVTFLASFLIWFMFAGLVVLWYVDGKITKEQAIHALLSAVICWVVTMMIKSLFPTPRPFLVNGDITLTISTYHGDGSFPSAHSAVAFALATTVYLHDKKVGFFFLAMAFMVGLGRILSNVHYPVDVFGGAILGVMVAYFLDKVHLHDLVKKITGK